MINNDLWKSILAFEFDSENDEYGFTVRLSTENNWTTDFTERAILEYKKFMFLAATSDEMVSPSEIVDIVWHQHLIFTISYQKFCQLLGKQIQHVPSTHNKADFQTFVNAKERTQILYEEKFDKADESIWNNHSMYETLHLKKSKFSLKTVIIIGINCVIALSIPFF